jgi:hypothetical protein
MLFLSESRLHPNAGQFDQPFRNVGFGNLLIGDSAQRVFVSFLSSAVLLLELWAEVGDGMKG